MFALLLYILTVCLCNLCIGGDLYDEYIVANQDIASFYSKSINNFDDINQEAMFYFQSSLLFSDRNSRFKIGGLTNSLYFISKAIALLENHRSDQHNIDFDPDSEVIKSSIDMSGEAYGKGKNNDAGHYKDDAAASSFTSAESVDKEWKSNQLQLLYSCKRQKAIILEELAQVDAARDEHMKLLLMAPSISNELVLESIYDSSKFELLRAHAYFEANTGFSAYLQQKSCDLMGYWFYAKSITEGRDKLYFDSKVDLLITNVEKMVELLTSPGFKIFEFNNSKCHFREDSDVYDNKWTSRSEQNFLNYQLSIAYWTLYLLNDNKHRRNIASAALYLDLAQSHSLRYKSHLEADQVRSHQLQNTINNNKNNNNDNNDIAREGVYDNVLDIDVEVEGGENIDPQILNLPKLADFLIDRKFRLTIIKSSITRDFWQFISKSKQYKQYERDIARWKLPTPVFIVGFPRSGSNLLEKILVETSPASLISLGGRSPLVLELYSMKKILDAQLSNLNLGSSGSDNSALDESRDNKYLDVYFRTLKRFAKQILYIMLNTVNERSVDAIGNLNVPNMSDDNYMKNTMKPLGLNSNIRFIIDSHGANYAHIGLIRLLFPRAIIINMVRDPADTLAGCMTTLFSSPEYHTYVHNSSEIVEEYLLYTNAMQHFRSVFNNRVGSSRGHHQGSDYHNKGFSNLLHEQIIDLSYESLVGNLKEVVRDLYIRVLASADVINSKNVTLSFPIHSTRVGRWLLYVPFFAKPHGRVSFSSEGLGEIPDISRRHMPMHSSFFNQNWLAHLSDGLAEIMIRNENNPLPLSSLSSEEPETVTSNIVGLVYRPDSALIKDIQLNWFISPDFKYDELLVRIASGVKYFQIFDNLIEITRLLPAIEGNSQKNIANGKDGNNSNSNSKDDNNKDDNNKVRGIRKRSDCSMDELELLVKSYDREIQRYEKTNERNMGLMINVLLDKSAAMAIMGHFEDAITGLELALRAIKIETTDEDDYDPAIGTHYKFVRPFQSTCITKERKFNFEKVIDVNSINYYRANYLYLKGDYQKAAESYQALISNGIDEFEILFKIADTLSKAPKFAESDAWGTLNDILAFKLSKATYGHFMDKISSLNHRESNQLNDMTGYSAKINRAIYGNSTAHLAHYLALRHMFSYKKSFDHFIKYRRIVGYSHPQLGAYQNNKKQSIANLDHSNIMDNNYYNNDNDSNSSAARIHSSFDEIRSITRLALLLRDLSITGVNTSRPLFVVGFPRSGVNLLQQVLQTHDSVLGFEDEAFISQLSLEILRNATAIISKYHLDLNEADLAQMYHSKMSKTHENMRIELQQLAYKVGSKFLDKLQFRASVLVRLSLVKTAPKQKPPSNEDVFKAMNLIKYAALRISSNFKYLPLMKVIFPQSQFINIYRDPMDNLLGLLSQPITDTTFNLKTLTNEFILYVKTMNYYRSSTLFDSNSLILYSYESLVVDKETSASILFNKLGLSRPKSADDGNGASKLDFLYNSDVGTWLYYSPFMLDCLSYKAKPAWEMIECQQDADRWISLRNQLREMDKSDPLPYSHTWVKQCSSRGSIMPADGSIRRCAGNLKLGYTINWGCDTSFRYFAM